MKTVLLLSDHPQSDIAEQYAKELLDVIQVQRHSRYHRTLDKVSTAEVLLNFLSAQKVPKNVLDRFRYAINFHPAPPEYPGVGSASLALYDKRETHGVTAHMMTDTFDAGQIIRVRRFRIDPSWGYKALFSRALDECVFLFRDVIRDIEGGLPLAHSTATWARQAYTAKEYARHPAFTEVAS